ncbi:S1C family serine protease [Oxalobacter formigenes]
MNLFHFVRQCARVCLGLSIVALSAGNVFAAPVTVNGMPDLTPLVEKTSPAVVFIMNNVNVQPRRKPESFQEFVSRVFGEEKDQKRETLPEEKEKITAYGGSGFIISPDGYILTNQHVVEGADELVVKLKDNRYFKARLLGADKTTDVALLKISSKRDLPYLKMGKSANVKAGQWVVAIGSPRFMEDSVSFGVVSNKSRERGEYLPFIQMDVAVNPGNSGGPAINMAGEVIGINSQIVTKSGGFAGISLAIPIDDALKIANELKLNGSVTRGYVGIITSAMDAHLAKSMRFSYPNGVFVDGIEKGTPAERAGIEPRDIILQFNNRVLYHPLELIRLIGESKPGEIAHFQIWRSGKEFTIPVVIAKKMTDGANKTYFTVK